MSTRVEHLEASQRPKNQRLSTAFTVDTETKHDERESLFPFFSVQTREDERCLKHAGDFSLAAGSLEEDGSNASSAVPPLDLHIALHHKREEHHPVPSHQTVLNTDADKRRCAASEVVWRFAQSKELHLEALTAR